MIKQYILAYLEQGLIIEMSPEAPPEPEPESEEPVEIKKGSEVSDDIKDSLESDDPWMQRKNEE